MGTQEYRANYRAAMQEANWQLAEIFREFEQLQLRKEILEDVVGALEPFLPAHETFRYESPRQELVRPEPVRHEREVPASVAAAPVAAPPSVFHEPVRPAAFAPSPDVTGDPIQSRINRALGLAVA